MCWGLPLKFSTKLAETIFFLLFNLLIFRCRKLNTSCKKNRSPDTICQFVATSQSNFSNIGLYWVMPNVSASFMMHSQLTTVYTSGRKKNQCDENT